MAVKRRRSLTFAVLVTAVLLVAPSGQAVAAPLRCGNKLVHGRSVAIVAQGLKRCSSVRHVVGGRCRTGKVWSCVSLRPPDPLVVWFKTRERFARRWSVVIEGRRGPCEDAAVSQLEWRESADDASVWAAPTARQVLADDILRCRQLQGMTYDQVRALLGRPDGSHGARKTYMTWEIGPERSSFFPIDGEILTLNFDRQGRFTSAGMQST